MTGYATNLKSLVFEGTADDVFEFVREPENLNAKDGEGFTLLHWAARKRNLELVNGLVQLKADVNVRSDENITPLHFAVKYDGSEQDYMQIVEFLLENSAEVDAKDKLGSTPLHWAIYGNLVEVVRKLIESGANVKEGNNKGSTPLHWAKSVEVVELLLDNGAEINIKDESGATPLHRLKSNSVVRKLLESGANVNARDNNGLTPLHNVSSIERAKTLLEYKADVNAKDNKGITPLQKAWANDCEVVADFLANCVEQNDSERKIDDTIHKIVFEQSNTELKDDDKVIVEFEINRADFQKLIADCQINLENFNESTKVQKWLLANIIRQARQSKYNITSHYLPHFQSQIQQ